MSNNKTTFYKFLKDHDIQIPLIQRDYVQGRALDSKAQEKRDDFVSKLLNAILSENNSYNLDFIYGAREDFGVTTTQKQSTTFLPLDGQQRLTTLYLLHWYLLECTQPTKDASDEEKSVFAARLEDLSKFSYKTRISSKRFCEKLTSTNFLPTSIIDQIKAKYWYDCEMKSDPTIQAMIEMLEHFESALDDAQYKGHLKEMTNNLFDKECITFSLLDMEEYNLTDGLYVKMNARGKELTAFENWKADFIALVSENTDDKKRFTRGIEHEWNDVFWTIAYRKYSDSKKNGNEGEKYPRIDESFMNFFDNMCRLLFFISSDKKDPKADDYKLGLWSTVKEVFSKQDMREKLFLLLDTLSFIKKEGSFDDFFNDIFYTDSSTDWQTHTTKVKLFGTNKNLFDATCSSNEFEWSHVMLYAILTYCTKFNVYKANDNLLNYVRVCRNYLDEHNYFASSSVSIVGQVRANEMKEYDAFFTMLQNNVNAFDSLRKPSLKNDYVKTECDKLAYYQDADVLKLVRKIEDMTYTHGNIMAFKQHLDKCIGNPALCEKTWEAIYAFRNASSLEKVQLFCIFGYKGIEVKDCAHGKAVFLGGEFDGTPRWMVHFRKKFEKNDNRPLKDWFNSYMNEYQKTGNLSTIITANTGNAIVSPATVVDYMLKYPDVLASQVYWRKEINEAPFYFAMQNPWKDLDIITIHSFSATPLNRAYQTCPMANAVARKMKRFDNYSTSNPRRMTCVGEAASKEGIIINKAGDWNNTLFKLWFDKFEWKTDADSYNNLSQILQTKFANVPGTNEYILNANDLISDVVDFMNEVVSDFEIKKML